MSINRQFSLPNCVLILEGLSSASEGTGTARAELSILTRFECYFAREKQALIGGLDLLQSLIFATNDCVQACISGVPSAPRKRSNTFQVEIKPNNGGFDLTVPEDLLSQGLSNPSKNPDEASVQLHISAVQLFDLMEAIDQLAADQHTLPALQTAIRPRSRAETLSGSVLVEKSAPIAIGTVSVAAAAAALFFVPIPKVPTPKAPTQPTSPLVQPSALPPAAAPPNSPLPSTSPRP